MPGGAVLWKMAIASDGGEEGMDEPIGDMPQEFSDLVDQFIELANRLGRTWPTGRISSVIMYAAARYNAFNFEVRDPEPEKNRERAAEYFVEQYRAMLRENMAKNLGQLYRKSRDQEPESS
jgi:hypothetical protein